MPSTTLRYSTTSRGNNALSAARMMAAAREANADLAFRTNNLRSDLRHIAKEEREGECSAAEAAEARAECRAHARKYGVTITNA